jgi:hypothetical protein
MSTSFNPQFTSDTDFSLSQLYEAARARTWPGRTPLPVQDLTTTVRKEPAAMDPSLPSLSSRRGSWHAPFFPDLILLYFFTDLDLLLYFPF